MRHISPAGAAMQMGILSFVGLRVVQSCHSHPAKTTNIQTIKTTSGVRNEGKLVALSQTGVWTETSSRDAVFCCLPADTEPSLLGTSSADFNGLLKQTVYDLRIRYIISES